MREQEEQEENEEEEEEEFVGDLRLALSAACQKCGHCHRHHHHHHPLLQILTSSFPPYCVVAVRTRTPLDVFPAPYEFLCNPPHTSLSQFPPNLCQLRSIPPPISVEDTNKRHDTCVRNVHLNTTSPTPHPSPPSSMC